MNDMNLKELQQLKQDLANGVIVSRQTWVKVLDAAIEKRAKKGIHCQEFHELAMGYRAAPPGDSAPYEAMIEYIEQWHMEEE